MNKLTGPDYAVGSLSPLKNCSELQLFQQGGPRTEGVEAQW
jgi:hypothetical protein